MSRNRNTRALGEYIVNKRENDGMVCIDVSLSDTALYDPMSIGFYKEINSDIYSYIEEKANLIPHTIPLKIRFHGIKITEAEENEVRQIMEKHYSVMLLDKQWDKITSTRKLIVMSVFGVIMLAIYFYLSLFAENPVLVELFSVLGSFSLWEAAGSFLLERPGLKRECKDIEQFRDQTIEFCN